MSLNRREKAVRQRLKDDFEHYGAKCLKIRAKEAVVEVDGKLYMHRDREKLNTHIKMIWDARSGVAEVATLHRSAIFTRGGVLRQGSYGADKMGVFGS